MKIPRWIRQRIGKQIEFEFSAGASFTEDVKKYALIEEKIYLTNDLTKEEITYLLENITNQDRKVLYNYALKTKQVEIKIIIQL